MANLIIKPTSGGSLILQDEGGTAANTIDASGNTQLAGTLGVTGNVTVANITASGTTTGFGDPGWTMIKSITASSSADVQFINGSASVVLDATYQIYKLFGINIIPATDTAIPQLHMTTNAGSAWTAVTGSFIAGGGTSGGTTGAATPEYFATGGFYEPDYGTGSGSGEVACFEATIYLPSATNANVLTHISTIANTSNNNRYVGMGMHMANAVENIDGIKIVLNTGNIAAGIFKLYGIKA